MINTRDDQPDGERDSQANITHFIPSVQLKGTRADKLETLDQLIAHLEALRRSLNEGQPEPGGWMGPPPRQLTRSDMWWAAGLLLAATICLLTLGIRACASVNV